MRTSLCLITVLATTVVACSSSAPDRDDGQPTNIPLQTSNEPDVGKQDRSPPWPPDPDIAGATAVLTATTTGALCLLDSATGALIEALPSTAIDLFSSPAAPSQAFVTAWSEDGGGMLRNYDVSNEGLTLRGEESLYFEDARLLDGPTPLIALGVNEGTTLFVAGEGRGVFGVGSFLSERDVSGIDVFLLEYASKDPRLLHLRWDAGLREVSRAMTSTPAFSCPPRLVRSAPELLVTGIQEGALLIDAPDGASRTRLENAAAPNACVEDALWLEGTEDIAVVTGPDTRIHLVSSVGAHEGETLVMAGQLGHDPRPHRRLAYDPCRSRLWIALSEQLEVRRRTADGHLEREDAVEEGCDAESVTLVW